MIDINALALKLAAAYEVECELVRMRLIDRFRLEDHFDVAGGSY